jgi:hypothetical protein
MFFQKSGKIPVQKIPKAFHHFLKPNFLLAFLFFSKITNESVGENPVIIFLPTGKMPTEIPLWNFCLIFLDLQFYGGLKMRGKRDFQLTKGIGLF